MGSPLGDSYIYLLQGGVSEAVLDQGHGPIFVMKAASSLSYFHSNTYLVAILAALGC